MFSQSICVTISLALSFSTRPSYLVPLSLSLPLSLYLFVVGAFCQVLICSVESESVPQMLVVWDLQYTEDTGLLFGPWQNPAVAARHEQIQWRRQSRLTNCLSILTSYVCVCVCVCVCVWTCTAGQRLCVAFGKLAVYGGVGRWVLVVVIDTLLSV